MRALITGATGFVGERLLEHLQQPVVLSRNADGARKKLAKFNPTVFAWNPLSGPPPIAAFEGVDTVFHLAGEPVAEGRWTEKKKQALRDSRIVATQNLIDGMAALGVKPRVLVAASAVGYYGDRGDETLDENSSPASDFLAQLCIDWEKEAAKAQEIGVRTASIRIGIVLGPNGGALKKMLPPFKMGVGSALGSGKQWMPWIHREDLVRLFLYTAERESLRGPVNGVAPNPVTNAEFTRALGKALGHWTVFPNVPKFALNLMFGELASVLLASQRVLPKKAQEAGFQFQYPQLEAALAEIFSKA